MALFKNIYWDSKPYWCKPWSILLTGFCFILVDVFFVPFIVLKIILALLIIIWWALFLVLGTPGGSTIITTIAQIITNVIDFDMSLKESVESKRFHHQWLPDVIQIEKNSLGKDVIDNLILYGHDIKYRSSIGEANCILINGNLKFGCSDSRRGSVAIGY